jgi:hypothetical protein
MTRAAIPDEVVRWGERIDELKGLYGIATDAELAVYLCVSKQGLHNFRSGITRAPSVATSLQIMRLLGEPWARDAMAALLPKRTLDALARQRGFLDERCSARALRLSGRSPPLV